MIRISQIDSDLSIYKNKKVVLLELGLGTQALINLMRYHGIKIDYICSIKEKILNTIFDGVEIISLEYLIEYAQKNENNITVQLATKTPIGIYLKQLNYIGIKNVVSYEEAWQVLNFNNKFDLVKKNQHLFSLYDDTLNMKRDFEEKPNFLDYIFLNSHLEEFIFICSIPKTGDHTLMETLNHHGINYHMMKHTPTAFDKKLVRNLDQKVKLIVGIREPISQNLSVLYQDIGSLIPIFSTFMLKSNKVNLFKDGGDAQELFDIRFDYENIGLDKVNVLSAYFDMIKENVIDLSKYEFDKEKGYMIAIEDNIEVFVYQIEKMDNIIHEMSDWIGQTQFDEWVMGNEASNKWISNSYKQAQKELVFTKEYFDSCYNNTWLKHFYLDEDIEKFKKKWRPHIKGYMTTIVFICEENNIKSLSVAIISLLENANTITDYEVYIIHQNKYSQENYYKILDLENKYIGCKIIFKQENTIDNFDCLSISTFISKTIANIHKCIYLDINIVVQKDLSDLYNIALDNYSIGAVREINSVNEFNSSVMIIDIEKVRKFNAEITTIELKYNLKAEFFEEEKSFNFRSKIKMNSSLQRNFDLKELKSALKENVIFSYHTNNYPLKNDKSSFTYDWWKNFRKSPLLKINREKCVNPKVSVVLPVYNVSKYLSECLDSIINQTLEEIEIICIDDGSTDSSLEILQEYAKFDNRITILEIENNNIGAGTARNRGIDIAKGEYLSILDSDDFFELKLLELAYNNAKVNDSDIVIYNFLIFNQKNEKIYFPSQGDLKIIDGVFSSNDIKDVIFNSFYHSAWTKMFKRKFIKNFDIKFQENCRIDDVYFTNISLITANKITVLDKYLVYYRQGINSQMTQQTNPLSFVDAFKKLKNEMILLNKYSLFERSFLQSLLKSALYHLDIMQNEESFIEVYRYVKNNLNSDFDLTNIFNEPHSNNLIDKYNLILNSSFNQIFKDD